MEFDLANGRRRGKGSKHVWTSDEDENLINSLIIELKEKGIYNTEGGGFKHGVFKELERILQVKLPGHGLKENPYIQSRYKLLKRQYQHFYDLRAAGQGSGFGWDDNRKCLTTSTDVWEEYMQGHLDCGFLKKPFIHYDQLAIIWGKDRATGNNSEASGDIIEDLDNEQEEENDDNTDTMAGLDDIDSRFTQSSTVKRPDGETAPEQQNMDNRQKLNEELRKISSLSLSERFKVGRELVRDKDSLDYFFTIEDDEKEVFVRELLQSLEK
ncbi:hypothetical protein BUALT_Bualt18G0042800 [Buddleja alternifolia]|uniref:Myb/SANT-like domain-containing protein n=1 Tax=Buddleja alternifolia TaxID=168488 RepID=A0AAV6WAZ4_9LAMI|nr:hypothetical protein BUALT_Bualt18G0042800 [Buddleja alternifolia]